MWDFLSSIVRAFLLLRDAFGYLIPGAVLFGSVAYAYKLKWTAETRAEAPEWLAAVVLLIGCYVAGQVLVAIGYLLIDILKSIAKNNRTPAWTAAPGKDVLFFRYVYPDLFLEYERRSTVNIMRIGLSVALWIDTCLLDWPLKEICIPFAGFLLFNGYTGAKHVAGYGASTVEAAREAQKKKIPYIVRK